MAHRTLRRRYGHRRLTRAARRALDMAAAEVQNFGNYRPLNAKAEKAARELRAAGFLTPLGGGTYDVTDAGMRAAR